MMNSVLLLLCATLTIEAQWTPDPFCPFPSDHVTRYHYYGNCSLYWECYEGAKYVMQCPEGLEFNAPLQECDTPEIANCDPFISTTDKSKSSTYTTASSNPEPTRDPLCPYPSEKLIYFPYPGDCTKYYECYEGNKYTYNCPNGLWWHEEISQCDYPGDFCNDNSTTSSADPVTSTTENPDDGPTCPAGDDKITFYPYKGDCTKYWECYEGNRYLKVCPAGLWWNNVLDACDYPGDFCKN